MCDSRDLARVLSVSGLDWRESMRDWEKRTGVSLKWGAVSGVVFEIGGGRGGERTWRRRGWCLKGLVLKRMSPLC